MNEEILALFLILKYFTLQRKLLALTDFQNFKNFQHPTFNFSLILIWSFSYSDVVVLTYYTCTNRTTQNSFITIHVTLLPCVADKRHSVCARLILLSITNVKLGQEVHFYKIFLLRYRYGTYCSIIVLD